MCRRLPLALLLLAFAAATEAAAQPARSGVVSGRVVDAETGTPLPGAHVFFSTTMKGMATDATGRFSFAEGAPVGTQRLHASMMGYEAQTLDTLLHAGRRYRLRLALAPTVIEGETVDVSARRADDWTTQGDDDWEDHLAKFNRLFVGETPEAEAVTLENAGRLAFDANWWGRLRADAGAPLVFKNRALGYRVRYHLAEFEGTHSTVRWDGEPFFEALAPADSAEAARWRTNRRRAFHGSLRHFLLALLGDSLSEAGFHIRREGSPQRAFGSVRRRVRSARPERLLEVPPAAMRDTLPEGTRLLDFDGRLRITYTREPEDPAFSRWQRARRARRDRQRSYIELDDGAVTLDPAGEIVEPYGATLFGYFAFERLAALLPKEYRP
jgi:hypothetical protein